MQSMHFAYTLPRNSCRVLEVRVLRFSSFAHTVAPNPLLVYGLLLLWRNVPRVGTDGE